MRLQPSVKCWMGWLQPIPALPRFSRLGWLMGLYGENFQRLERLFPVSALREGRYISHSVDGLVLRT